MRNKILLVTTLAAIATGCQSNNEASPDAGSYGEEVSEIKVSDCAAFSAPFSSCPAANKADGMTDAQKKTQCEAVKTVALNNYETALGKKPDCTDGWVFGPNPVIEPCAKDPDKKVCKLTAKDKSGAGWPSNDTWSECLNDWVVMCTAKYPAAMGIGAKAPVCFHDAIDWDKVGATSVTGREVCQSLVDGKLPPKCDPKLCAPKMKPGTKKKGPTACAATFAAGSGSGCEETWSCESCDPATDTDCAYDTSCGCVQCEPGEDNPACSEDLVCETPTPTPTPTIEPSPTITPSPTIEPSPTVSPTVSPTPDATPYATPYPTPYATPYPTPYATPSPTPYATPLSF